jgi:hypothetical protein
MSYAPTKEGKDFKARITAGVKIGMPAEEVRKFLKAEGRKMMEFPKPRAISTSIRYDQGLLGYKGSVAAIHLDENDRVKEIVFTLDQITGL